MPSKNLRLAGGCTTHCFTNTYFTSILYGHLGGQVLGSGFSVIELGRGGRGGHAAPSTAMVLSVPVEVDADQSALMELAQVRAGVV